MYEELAPNDLNANMFMFVATRVAMLRTLEVGMTGYARLGNQEPSFQSKASILACSGA